MVAIPSPYRESRFRRMKDHPRMPWTFDTSFRRAQVLSRAVFLLICLSCYIWNHAVNGWIAALWEVCQHSAWFRWDTFEPSLVAVAFTLSMAPFYAIDKFLPPSLLRRYKLHDSEYKDLKGWHLGENTGGIWRTTVLYYMAPLMLFDLYKPRRHMKLPSEAPTVEQVFVDVVASLFIYDALFMCGHFAVHHVPFLMRKVHATHHRHTQCHAMEAMRHSFFDEWLDVGCSIAAVNLSGAHPLSRAAYNCTIVYLLCEIHSGYNFPWAWSNIVPLGIWGGAKEHCEHHRTGRTHYQKFFTYMDNLLGYVPERRCVHSTRGNRQDSQDSLRATSWPPKADAPPPSADVAPVR